MTQMLENEPKNVKYLTEELNKTFKDETLSVKTRKYEVSEATTFFSSVYERVRNTIDYKDEHLIKRFAIQRFLRVSLTSKTNPEDITDLLIKDLLRGRYLTDIDITDWKVEKIQKIVHKYIKAKGIIKRSNSREFQNGVWDSVLGVAASEIEKTLDPLFKPEIFVNLLGEYISAIVSKSAISDNVEDLQAHIFLACHRALVRSDISILTYHAMYMLHRDFFENPTDEVIEAFILAYPDFKKKVEKVLGSRFQDLLYLNVRRISPPIKVLEGVLERNPEMVEHILSDPRLLRDKAESYILSYYKDLKKKLNVRITRMLFYLFITKMTLALLIEAPVDLYLYGSISYIILLINTLVPVVLFYLIAKNVKTPGKANDELIFKTIDSVVYSDKFFLNEQSEKFFLKRISRSRRSSPALALVYSALYLLVYGIIFTTLTRYGFNFVSTMIFIFFVSILSYFAWNVRARAKDLEVLPSKEGLPGSILTIISLPILKVGKMLSIQVGRFNFFTLFFDLILEAPFKIIIQFFEDLIDFLKSKHEEVVQG